MPTQILAVGTTAANSGDVVVDSGAALTVGLKDAAGPVVNPLALVHVTLKDDVGEYFRVEELTAATPALVLSPGTWRFSRVAGASCGVFSA
jgi:hypothetical protein